MAVPHSMADFAPFVATNFCSSQAAGIYASLDALGSSFLAELGIKLFELIDDSTLLNMLEYFSGQTAARFSRTCRRFQLCSNPITTFRHRALYKHNELRGRLRPSDNIQSMALRISDHPGEPIFCRNSQVELCMNTIIVPAASSPVAQGLLHLAKPNFRLTARSDKVDVYMDKTGVSPHLRWVVEYRKIKGSRARTHKVCV